LLDVSGAAEVIARTLIRAFGIQRASLAILAAAYLIGIPVLFNVAFLLLIPVMWRLQRETGKSLLYFVLPLSFSLGITHSLIPPHPGIVGAVSALAPDPNIASQVMVETIIFGTLMGVPLVLVGWLGVGRWWAKRHFVAAPEHPAAQPTSNTSMTNPPSFATALLIVVLPLLLSILGFGADLLKRLDRLPHWMTIPMLGISHPAIDWLKMLGHPTMVLLLPTMLAFIVLGVGRGMSWDRLSKLTGEGLQDVGTIALLFGAAGGFKQIIEDSGAGAGIAALAEQLPLTPVAFAYLVAVMARIALGSATASIVLASSLLADYVQARPGQETLLVLAISNGVTILTQPADSGFWMVKEYCNLTVRDVMIRFNACRIPMSLTGLLILLIYERWK
jgi:H+/gluconate symporter-like permease